MGVALTWGGPDSKGKSEIFGVWAAPGGRETLQKDEGRSPSSFWRSFPAVRGRPDPKIDGFPSQSAPVSAIPKCTQTTPNDIEKHLTFRVVFYLFDNEMADPKLVRDCSGTSCLVPRGRF